MKKVVLKILLFPLALSAAPLDTNYFTFYKNEIITRAYISTDIFTLKQVNQNDKTAIFKPNQSLSSGVGIAYRWLVLSFGMTMADLTNNQIYGKSKETNFGLSATVNKSNFNFSIQNYKGFFIDNYSELGLKVNPKGLIPNLPNLSMNTIQVNYSYFFNGTKFSISPYIIGNTISTKTCGSFILSANILHYSLKNDSSFLSGISRFQSDQQIKSLTSIAPYISLGYGQNIIISKNLSAILVLNGGLGIEKQDYITKLNDALNYTTGSFRLDGFAGIMYNTPNYFISLTTNAIFVKHELIKSSFETQGNRFMFNFGYRFKPKSRLVWVGNKIGL